MESLVKETLLEILKNKNVLFQNNSVFYLEDQQFYVLDKWNEALSNGAHVDMYCDFMKAFDTVPHQRLLRVLRFYNTPENLIK